MKHTIKRALALFIALLLATPGTLSLPTAALAEAPGSGVEPPVLENGAVELDFDSDDDSNGLTIEGMEDIPDELPDADSEEPTAVYDEEQTEVSIENEVRALGAMMLGELQKVSVSFETTPEWAVVTVYSAATEAVTDEVSTPDAIPVEADGTYLLPPGDYVYYASAEGCAPIGPEPFSVSPDDADMTIAIDLSAPEAMEALFVNAIGYIDENGDSQPCTQYTTLTAETTALSGWVVVSEDVDMGDTRLEVSGEAHLILCDGVTLTAKKGIQLSDGNTLTIYGQTDGTGKLYAGTTDGEDSTCDNGNAGIGGNSDQKGGALTINGGAVTAKGGKYGAGIGGGDCGADGALTVNGGTVTANGGSSAAGIGGGFEGAGGEVTITGGTVKANAGYDAAGIGGGYDGEGGKVTITGGKVEATGNYRGAGIGGGNQQNNTGTLTVSFGNADDCLKASSYGGTVKVEDGHCIKYVDGNNTPHTFTGTLTDGQKSDIAGQELSKSTAALHSVTIKSGIANGTVTAGKAAAAEGETVELTAAPATGYMLDSFSVQANGEAVTVTNNQFTMPDADVTVGAVFVAIPNVTYIDENGEPQSCTQYTTLTDEATALTGWFVVENDVDMGETRLEVSGEAHLILCDGVTLTAKKGIQLSVGNTLTIYGQTDGTGKLYAGTTDGEDSTCDSRNAGIGGYSGQKGGALTINGGAVTAKGGNFGAGIGGGHSGAGGTLVVYGGTVNATGRFGSAGIGGGTYAWGGKVEVKGGKVTANGSANGSKIGAGIGGGADNYNTGTLTVSFGKDSDFLTADSYGGTVKVEDGYAIRYVADGITRAFSGTLSDEDKSNIAGMALNMASPTLHSVTISEGITGGTVSANKTSAVAYETVILTVEPNKDNMLSGLSYTVAGSAPVIIQKRRFVMPDANVTVTANFEALPQVPYIDYEDGQAKNKTLEPQDYSPLTAEATTLTGWVVVLTDVDMGDTRLEVSGEAHLVLCDDKTLTAPLGIRLTGVGNSLTIYAQSTGSGMGTLTINGVGDYCAGIGGNKSEKGGTLTIKGGTVNARGGYRSAGIGGSNGGVGGTLVVYGGTVTANGGYYGAGIGSGMSGAGGTLVVYGGTVTANGGSDGAGIGGGRGGAGDTLEVYGGTINATGGTNGSGIGGGWNSAGGNVTINGGTVTAKGGEYGAGIGGGGGSSGAGGIVKVNGGTVNATGRNGGSGIGVGNNYSGNTKGTLTVGFENDGDSLKANSYTGTVTVKDGYAVRYTSNGIEHSFIGTLTDDQRSEIAGKKLEKADWGCDGEGNFIISNVSGWNAFCNELASYDKGYFTGKTVKLGADIGTASAPITSMAGLSQHDFTGTFDG